VGQLQDEAADEGSGQGAQERAQAQKKGRAEHGPDDGPEDAAQVAPAAGPVFLGAPGLGRELGPFPGQGDAQEQAQEEPGQAALGRRVEPFPDRGQGQHHPVGRQAEEVQEEHGSQQAQEKRGPDIVH